jgi:hypothetical protein
MNQNKMLAGFYGLVVVCIIALLALTTLQATTDVGLTSDLGMARPFSISLANSPSSAPGPGASGRLLASHFRVSYLNQSSSAPSLDPDFENGNDDVVVPGLVEELVGPHGFPVASAKGLNWGTTYGGLSGNITDVYPSSNEILWWSTASLWGITPLYQEISPMPISNLPPWLPGGDIGGYRTVHWEGWFRTDDGFIDLLVAASDDCWVFVDGVLLLDSGGVKPYSSLFSENALSQGVHQVDIFYADRNQATEPGVAFNAYFWKYGRKNVQYSTVKFRPPGVQEVQIDVLPGYDPNIIYPFGQGVTPVAVLTSLDFDATTIDPTTVSLESAKAVRWAVIDVNTDGMPDMLFDVKTKNIGLAADGPVELTGCTWDNRKFEGTDYVVLDP